MDIRVLETALPPVVIIETDFVRDERGFFIEAYHRQRYAERGITSEFVQDNHSRSGKNVLRGIHYQDMRAPMGKLIRCTVGRIYDVAVDLRVGAPTFGKWIGVELSGENMKQVMVPPGFGHGFLTLSEAAEVQYRCSTYYAPETEGVIAWNDPDLGISWPCSDPILSRRDQQGMSLREYLKKPAFRLESTGA
ncbi:MAG: dTDP-4-dehydrorhamnose 3,5-epimerase [Acidobacteria bacterium]|nr:MAG: dTDP-4-dehydrorhamnose 3,5-epimerase [Acidobacteriota bacterium]